MSSGAPEVIFARKNCIFYHFYSLCQTAISVKFHECFFKAKQKVLKAKQSKTTQKGSLKKGDQVLQDCYFTVIIFGIYPTISSLSLSLSLSKLSIWPKELYPNWEFSHNPKTPEKNERENN